RTDLAGQPPYQDDRGGDDDQQPPVVADHEAEHQQRDTEQYRGRQLELPVAPIGADRVTEDSRTDEERHDDERDPERDQQRDDQPLDGDQQHPADDPGDRDQHDG